MRRLFRSSGWAAFGLATVYAVGLSFYSFLHPGWKPHRVETAWFVFAFVFLAVLTGRILAAGAPPFPEGTTGPDNTVRRRWLLAALAGVTLWIYRGALEVGYLSDDFVLLSLRGSGAWQQGSAELLRVLPVAVIQAVDRLFGQSGAVVAHALNVVLHCVNGGLVHQIARRLRFSDGAAVGAAALFLTCPAAPEAVVWISGLQDLLMTAACLGFVLAALDSRPPAVLLLCQLVGLLSKESAVVMPVLAAGALTVRGRPVPRAVIGTLLACVAIAAAFATWRVGHGGDFATAPTRYLLKEMLAGAFGTLALPWTTEELRPIGVFGLVMTPFIVLAAWTVARAPARAGAGRTALLGLAWVVVGIAPVYSLFFVSEWLEGSRYVYLAAAGWALALASAANAPGRESRVAVAGVGVVVVLWTLGAAGHVVAWQQAAAARDRILDAALATDRPAGCARVGFVGATDSVRGAFVFRNGLPEALARAGVAHAAPQADAACVFAWTGRSFERQH